MRLSRGAVTVVRARPRTRAPLARPHRDRPPRAGRSCASKTAPGIPSSSSSAADGLLEGRGRLRTPGGHGGRPGRRRAGCGRVLFLELRDAIVGAGERLEPLGRLCRGRRRRPRRSDRTSAGAASGPRSAPGPSPAVRGRAGAPRRTRGRPARARRSRRPTPGLDRPPRAPKDRARPPPPGRGERRGRRRRCPSSPVRACSAEDACSIRRSTCANRPSSAVSSSVSPSRGADRLDLAHLVREEVEFSLPPPRRLPQLLELGGDAPQALVRLAIGPERDEMGVAGVPVQEGGLDRPVPAGAASALVRGARRVPRRARRAPMRSRADHRCARSIVRPGRSTARGSARRPPPTPLPRRSRRSGPGPGRREHRRGRARPTLARPGRAATPRSPSSCRRPSRR